MACGGQRVAAGVLWHGELEARAPLTFVLLWFRTIRFIVFALSRTGVLRDECRRSSRTALDQRAVHIELARLGNRRAMIVLAADIMAAAARLA